VTRGLVSPTSSRTPACARFCTVCCWSWMILTHSVGSGSVLARVRGTQPRSLGHLPGGPRRSGPQPSVRGREFVYRINVPCGWLRRAQPTLGASDRISSNSRIVRAWLATDWQVRSVYRRGLGAALSSHRGAHVRDRASLWPRRAPARGSRGASRDRADAALVADGRVRPVPQGLGARRPGAPRARRLNSCRLPCSSRTWLDTSFSKSSRLRGVGEWPGSSPRN
jgi:hypothetical protein